jgi:hypothetical protein
MEQTVRSRYHIESFNDFRSLTSSIRSGTFHYHNSVYIEPSMVTLLIPMTDLGRISINAYFQAWPGWSVSPPRLLSLRRSVTDHNDLPLIMNVSAGTGAKESEVAHTSTLTSNIHSLFISFYRPTPKRWKIVIEKGAFPSDWVRASPLLTTVPVLVRLCTHHASLGVSQYAIHSHPALHSAILSPEQIENAIVPLSPRPGEDHLRTEDVVSKLAEIGDEVAVVWIGCVQYYTGQFFEVEPIARKTHEIVSLSGFASLLTRCENADSRTVWRMESYRALTLGWTWHMRSGTSRSS